jgi:hypothetical protein
LPVVLPASQLGAAIAVQADALRHSLIDAAELKRELRREDKALAETAALLVLSRKVEAIFSSGEAE